MAVDDGGERVPVTPRSYHPGPDVLDAWGVAELVDGLTELTVSTMARARDSREAGDSPYLAGAEILDVVDPFLDNLAPPVREAMVRHVRGVVHAHYTTDGGGA